MGKSSSSGRYQRLRSLLIEAREKNGLTQAQVAAKLNKPQSFVSKYENGERRLDVIEFIEVAEALGVDPVKLMNKVMKHETNHPR